MTPSKTRSHHAEEKKYGHYLRILLVVNTVLLVAIGTRIPSEQKIQQLIQKTEIQKMGGMENYELAQKIYESPSYKKEQDFIRKQNAKTYLQQKEQNEDSNTIAE